MARRKALISDASGTDTKIPDRIITPTDNNPPAPIAPELAAGIVDAAASLAVAPTLKQSALGLGAKASDDKELQEHMQTSVVAKDETKRDIVTIWNDLERIHGGKPKSSYQDMTANDGSEFTRQFPRVFKVTAEMRKDKVKLPWKYPVGKDAQGGDFMVDWVSRQAPAMELYNELGGVEKALAGAADTPTKWLVPVKVGEVDLKAEKTRLTGLLSYMTGRFGSAIMLAWFLRDLRAKMPHVGWRVMTLQKDGRTVINSQAPFRLYDATNEETMLGSATRYGVNQLLSMDIDRAIANGGTFSALHATLSREPQAPGTVASVAADATKRIATMDIYGSAQDSFAHFYEQEGAARVNAHCTKLKGDEQDDFAISFGNVFLGMMAAWENGMQTQYNASTLIRSQKQATAKLATAKATDLAASQAAGAAAAAAERAKG